ncbi:hypothetical protein [Borreliella yangtzensis]|uniref:hypothetical protein n=1 Tax=Borreliella yangtzensis TaxID=683292 RepID=UPI003B9FEB61
MYLHSTAKVEVDFYSGSLFLNGVDFAYQAFCKADLLQSTKFFNYGTIKNISFKSGLASQPPLFIFLYKCVQ